ncbi:hypothetical protein PGJ95_01905 [Acinetobacter baumannii]|nr:hypothetical protein [Acinetobacter baumannii]MDA4907663.1 hypothetical protein [Acinetobacter baumannii]MDA4911442.1 hypothetical protein [Acinetobacter baumannii]MDA4936910.1 hypothetical protein [Acinetobacter baumannii]MDA4947741.1 hypothetical protein [Acinetobacter baumannii]
MGWVVPVFRVKIDGNFHTLAYLKPTASEAFTKELAFVYNLINSSLTDYFQHDKDNYHPEELSLFFLNNSKDAFKLWKPDYQQLQIPFIYSFGIPNLDRLTTIQIDEIPLNFPHIFWTEEFLNRQTT